MSLHHSSTKRRRSRQSATNTTSIITNATATTISNVLPSSYPSLFTSTGVAVHLRIAESPLFANYCNTVQPVIRKSKRVRQDSIKVQENEDSQQVVDDFLSTDINSDSFTIEDITMQSQVF